MSLYSREEILRHLTSPGTCKCGLRCPFMLDEAFNFNSDVLGLPDNLPFTSDTLCKVRPHLSLHKVRRRVPKKALTPSKSKTPTKPQSSLKTVSIPLSPSPKKNKPANSKPDIKATSNIKSPALQLIQKSPSKKPVQTSVSYPIVDLQSLVAHLNAVAKSTGCQYTTANISLPWLTALQIPKQPVLPSKSSPSKSSSQIFLVSPPSGASPTRPTTSASVPSSPKIDNQSVLDEKRKTPPFTGISLIDANISKQESPSSENTLSKNNLEQLSLLFGAELKDANISFSKQESPSSENTLSKNNLGQLPSESKDADQTQLNGNANMETEMSAQSVKEDNTNELEDEQMEIRKEKIIEERNSEVTGDENETKQDMEVDKNDETQEMEEVSKVGSKTETTKPDFEDINQKSIVAEADAMDEIAAANVITRDEMETDEQVPKNERDEEDIANDIEEDANMERSYHTDLEQPQPDEMSDLKEQQDIDLDQTLNAEQQETLKQLDNEKKVPDKEQEQDESLDVTEQEVEEVTSIQAQSDNANEHDIKGSESPSDSPSTSVDSPFDPSLFGFPNYMYREYNLRKRSHTPLSSLMYDIPSSKLPRSTKSLPHSLQTQLQSDKSDDTPEKTSEKSDILTMQEKASEKNDTLTTEEKESEKSDTLAIQEKASGTPEAQEKVTLASEKIDTMAEEDIGTPTLKKSKKPTEPYVETTMEFLDTMNKKITNLMQEGMKQTSFAKSKEMPYKRTRSRRKSSSSERVPEVIPLDPDFFSEIESLPKKEYNFRKRKSNSTGSNPTSYYPIRKRTRQSVQQELKFLEYEASTKVFTETREESPDSVFSSPQSSLKIPFVATHSSSSHDNSDLISSPSVGPHNVGTSSLENKRTDNPLNKTADEVLNRPEPSKVGPSSADDLTLASSQASHIPVKRIKSDEDGSEVSSRARSSSCSSDWGWCHSLRNTEVRESAEDISTEKLVVSICRKTLPLVTNYSTVTCNPIPSYTVGDIVWAKAHQLPSWPGRIISHIEWKNTKLHAPPPGQVVIYFN